MEVDLLLVYLIIGTVLIFAVVGILIWAVVTIVRRSSGDNQLEQGEKTTARHSQLGGRDSSPEPTSSSPSSLPNDAVGPYDTEVLRVFRDESTSAISIEIDGKRYRNLTDIRDSQTGRQLLQTVADLSGFIHRITPVAKTEASSVTAEGQPLDASSTRRHVQQTPKAPEPGSLAKRGEALIANTSPRQRDPGSDVSSAGGLLGRAGSISGNSSSPEQAPPEGPERPPHDVATVGDLRLPPKSAEQKRDVGTFWGRALSPVQSSGPVGPRPLADELEDILKGLTDNASEKPERDVHFRTAIDGSLIIDVDGTSYEDLADITDPVAQQIIRAIIRKWEKE